MLPLPTRWKKRKWCGCSCSCDDDGRLVCLSFPLSFPRHGHHYHHHLFLTHTSLFFGSSCMTQPCHCVRHIVFGHVYLFLGKKRWGAWERRSANELWTFSDSRKDRIRGWTMERREWWWEEWRNERRVRDVSHLLPFWLHPTTLKKSLGGQGTHVETLVILQQVLSCPIPSSLPPEHWKEESQENKNFTEETWDRGCGCSFFLSALSFLLMLMMMMACHLFPLLLNRNQCISLYMHDGEREGSFPKSVRVVGKVMKTGHNKKMRGRDLKNSHTHTQLHSCVFLVPPLASSHSRWRTDSRHDNISILHWVVPW